jgi:hypothetical protein
MQNLRGARRNINREGVKMKLSLFLIVPAIAWLIAPLAAAGQQGVGMEWGQEARPDPVGFVGRFQAFIMEVPAVPPQETPIVLAQSGSTAGAAPQPDYILKDCMKSEHSADPRSAAYSVDSAGALKDFIQGRDNRDIDLALFKPSLLQGTQHGKITEGVDNLGFTSYRYDPNPDFYGDDQAIFMVEFEGKRYKVIYQIKVVEYVEDNTTCPPPKLIKVTE